jgi:predicted nucleic acid-binding protein
LITAVDTSVLIDFFGADRRFGQASRAALRRCADEGSLIGSALVWAEVVAGFARSTDAVEALERLGVGYDAIDRDVAIAAGAAWRRYRTAGGTRRRILSDFVVGAHAALRADRLLTRDRGFYRAHFTNLVIVEPGDGGR